MSDRNAALDVISQFHLPNQSTTFVLLLLVPAFLLRVGSAVALPVGDEAITLRVVREYGTLELLWKVPLIQPHFPGYYVLVDLWAMVFPLATARYISIVAGTLVPIVALLWFSQLLGKRKGLLAAGLLAFSPPLIIQSQWLRMYALLTLAVLVSWWAAWSYLQGSRPAWQYAIIAGVTLSIHPLAIAVVGAQLLWLVVEQHQTDWRHGFAGVVTLLAVVTAILLTPLLTRVLGFAGGYSIGQSDLHIQYADKMVEQAVVLPLSTLTGTAIVWPFVLLLAGVTLSMAVLAIRQRIWKTTIGRLVLCWVVGSLVFLYIGHAVRPVILLKYVCWLAPGVALLLVYLTSKTVGKWSRLSLSGVYIPNFILGLVFHAHVAMVAVWNSGVLANGSL